MGRVVLTDISKSYDGTLACDGIHLCVEPGEFFTFLGPSGCGKTTILRLIAGFIRPEKGSIHIGNTDVTQMDAEKRNIGMVFQNYALFPFMTVRENIQYGLKIQQRPPGDVRKKTAYYLEMVGLTGLEDRDISELSGGEQQRVALARSLAVEPRVLLLDEPISNLDSRLRDKMRDEIKTLQKKLGITTIFVTHDQREALTMSDRVAVFDRGKCLQIGSPEQIYSNPASPFVATFIGETNLFKVKTKNGVCCIGDGIDIVVNNPVDGGYISVRPQDIMLSACPRPRENSIPGQVKDRQFNGMSTDYSVSVKDLQFRVSVLNTCRAVPSFQAGEEIFLSFLPDSIHVLSG
ncbi:MAG: ABC transporter ATP-binding protein [Desulfobacterales bacterium]|nr:ABC transporter ATP-binding protein [Desulfobacterales bacterium]